MANLTVENLNRIVESGATEELFGAADGLRGAGSTAAMELRATREAQAQGLEVPASGGTATTGQTFLDVFKQSVDKVNTDQVQADSAIKELVAGRSKNIHETMLAIERADASLKLMMQVRNKILDAYKEIMRMQV